MKHVYLLLTVLALTGCIYTNHPVTYRVYYHSGAATNGQPPSDSRYYETNNTVTLLGHGTLEYDDCTFLGWEYNGTFYSAGDNITVNWDDINLFPVWDDGVDGPFLFEIDIENNTAIITGYNQYFTSSITIPETLRGKPVAAIGDSAFSNSSISEVVLPKNLKRIGVGAFSSNNIVRIIIPSSVETIGIDAFYDNSLTNITFSGSNLSEISPYAFAGNGLKDIIIPDSITTIGEGAFHENEIERIRIGTGVTVTDDTALGVNGASFKALYDTEKLAGLYTYKGNEWKQL